MKITKRIICVTVALLMLLSFSSCGVLLGGEVVMSYEGFSLNESDYLYLSALIKDNIVYSYQNYLYQYTGKVYSESEIMALPANEEGKTIADVIKETVVESAQRILVIEKICSDADLKITDQADLDEIQEYLDNLEFAYGGKDLFEIELAKMGFTKSSVERYEKYNRLLTILRDYRYGENGTAKIAASKVEENFLENYFKFEGCTYSFLTKDDDGNNTQLLYKFTDEEAKTYFYENYAKMKHVLYLTVDSTSGNALSDEQIAQAESEAKADLELILSGEKTIDDIKEKTDDNGYEYVFAKGTLYTEIEEAVAEMEIGEVRCVKSQAGYHIVEKEALTEEDLFGKKTESGETDEAEGGNYDDVISNMSRAKIREEAAACFEKLKSGELTSFITTDKDNYVYQKPAVITSGETNYASLETAIKEAKNNEYITKEFSSDCVFIVKKLELKTDDLTSDIYTKIEGTLINDEYYNYFKSFYDNVTINEDVLARFDINTVSPLDDKFYTDN